MTTHIGHISPDTVIQCATSLIENMYIQHSPVIILALAGSYSGISIQSPLEECLEIFCKGVLEEALRGFVDLMAESKRGYVSLPEG